MSRRKDRDLEEKFGPEYPDLGSTVAKFRRLALKAGGVRKLTEDVRKAYGAAVHEAFVRRTRSVPGIPQGEPKCHCASGTSHSDGRDIAKAIRGQHAGALASYPSLVRRSRTPKQWAELYLAVIAEKHGKAWRKAVSKETLEAVS